MRALHAFAARAGRYAGWRSLSTPFSASPRSHPAASRPQRSQFTGLLPYLIICAQFSPPMALLNFPPFVKGGQGGVAWSSFPTCSWPHEYAGGARSPKRRRLPCSCSINVDECSVGRRPLSHLEFPECFPYLIIARNMGCGATSAFQDAFRIVRRCDFSRTVPPYVLVTINNTAPRNLSGISHT
jgi:hypothetical protein